MAVPLNVLRVYPRLRVQSLFRTGSAGMNSKGQTYPQKQHASVAARINIVQVLPCCTGWAGNEVDFRQRGKGDWNTLVFVDRFRDGARLGAAAEFVEQACRAGLGFH